MLQLHKLFITKKVFITWIISYIILAVIIIVIASGIYFATSNIIESQTVHLNRGMLMQTRQVIDGQLHDISQIAVRVAMDSDVKSIMYEKDAQNVKNKYNNIKVMHDLKMCNITNTFIEYIFVYFSNTEQIIDSNTVSNIDIFYSTTNYSNNMSFKDYSVFIKNVYKGNFLPFHIKSRTGDFINTASYIQSFPLEWANEKLGNVLIIINHEKINNLIKSIKDTNGGEIIIADDECVLFSTTGINISQINEIYKNNQEKSLLKTEFEGEEAVVLYLNSEVSNWKYIYIIPTKLFLKQLRYIQRLTLYIFTGCLILGIFIALYFSKKNYLPLVNVVKSLKRNFEYAGEIRDKDEFSFIIDSISNMVKEKKEILNKLEMQKDVIKNNYLAKMLKGLLTVDASFKEVMKFLNINFKYEGFVVAVFMLEYDILGKSASKEQNTGLVFSQFLFKDIAGKHINRKFTGYITEIDELTVCIINLSATSQEIKAFNEIYTVMEDIHKEFTEKYKMFVTTALSGIHFSAEEIKNAYCEALEGLDYRLIFGRGAIIMYNDIKNMQQKFYYPIEIEHKLTNYVKAGDYTNAKNLLDFIFESNFSEKSISLQWAKCLIYNIVGTIIKIMKSLEDDKCSCKFQNKDLVERIIICDTLDEMKTKIYFAIAGICDYFEEKKKSHNIELNRKILAYITENYKDYNLCTSMIADAFNLNCSYLARFFNEQNGQSINDYIHGLRMAKAKELLAECNMSINDIALEVGYSNVVTFMRIFKKREAITPGKYREVAIKNMSTQ